MGNCSDLQTYVPAQIVCKWRERLLGVCSRNGNFSTVRNSRISSSARLRERSLSANLSMPVAFIRREKMKESHASFAPRKAELYLRTRFFHRVFFLGACVFTLFTLTSCASHQQQMELAQAQARANELAIQRQREEAEIRRQESLTPEQRNAEEIQKSKQQQAAYQAWGTIGGAVIRALGSSGN